MKKLKEKLIHWLGGYTHEDFMVKTRPERSYISRFSIRTLKLNKLCRNDVITNSPEFMNKKKRDMAHMIGDKMLEEALIEFWSSQEDPDMLKIMALAKIVVPTEVSE